MSDIQKLKALMVKYNSVVKKKGYDDGGEVTPQDLAPYMPTPQEEAASGFPPGPQRASYIANKKYQAAQAAKPGYDDGGTVAPKGNVKAYEEISNGFTGKKKVDPNVTTNGPGGESVDPEDAVEAAEANTPKPKGYDEGGDVTPDDNQHLEQVLEQMPENSSSETPSPAMALPNGGLDGQALLNYIKANPGPVATTGLNPNNPRLNSDDDSDDEEPDAKVTLPKSTLKNTAKKVEDSEDDSNDDSLTVPVSKDSSLLNNDQVAPDSKQSIQDMLNSVATSGKQQNTSPYGDASLQAIKDAQQHDKIGSAIAGLLGGSASQDQYFKNGNVNRLLQQRQAQDQDTAHEGAVMQLGDAKAESDPNSGISSFAKQFAKQQIAQAGMNLNVPDNMSYSTMKQFYPQITKSIDAQLQNQERLEAAKLRIQSMAGQQSDRQNNKQNQVMQQTQQLLESARGNPAAAQAERDIYSAQKASSLANLYGDPNKLSQQQVNMLAQEVGKIAAGGVSSHSELQGIQSNALVGRMSKTTGDLLNTPTPAHAANWVKQYTDYTNALSKDAQKVIQDKYGRVIESRKGQLSPDNYQALQDNYVNRFNSPDRSPQSDQSSQLSPQDKQAIQWANSNKGDPRAQQILKLHGIQ